MNHPAFTASSGRALVVGGTAHPVAAAKPGYDPAIAARVRAERKATREARRQRLLNFVPRDSTAMMGVQVEFCTGVVKKHFPLWFARVQSSAFMLREVLGGLTSSAHQAEAEAIADAKIGILRRDAEAELRRLKSLGIQHGLEGGIGRRTAPERFVLSVYTTQAMAYLHLLRVLDEIVWYLEALRIKGVIRNSEKLSIRRAYRTKCEDLATEVSDIWARAKAAAQRDAEDRANVVSVD